VRVTDTSGNPLNGLALFEKGFIHRIHFVQGVAFTGGRFTIELPAEVDVPEVQKGFWGMHIYATDYIYYPKEIEVKPGREYTFDVALAPDPNPEDDPIIHDVEFLEKGEGVEIRMEVSSPNGNLGPQVLALNSRTGEAFSFTPPRPVPNLTVNFPDGVYTLQYGNATDPSDWYFVVADHSCSNGPVQGYPIGEKIIPALAEEGGSPAPPTTVAGASAVERGAQLFKARGCINCHHPDRESLFEEKDARTGWKIGPGLKNVLKNDVLPASGRPATEENVQNQIRTGGKGMPPFATLGEDEVSDLIAYLKTL
jgi:mono/diheme cytochrome c family protein